MLINKEYDWQNKCILIAEDEEINYMFIEKILEGTGAKLLRAINGKQAVYIVNSDQAVDLVLMDIIMPEMDGIETARQARRYLHDKVFIILMTEQDYSVIADKAKEAGVDGFIQKPFLISEFQKEIEKLIK